MNNDQFLKSLKKIKPEELKSVKYNPDTKYRVNIFLVKFKYIFIIIIKYLKRLIKLIKELFKVNK